jgi:chemotaxis protein CheZ
VQEATVLNGNETLYKELGELTRYIETAMRKMDSVRGPVMSTTEQLPMATTHLADLRRLTEEGTHEVMRLVEAIQDDHTSLTKTLADVEHRAQLRQDNPVLDAVVHQMIEALAVDDKRLMDIMTALSFQDLVAQRVKKLVAIVEDIQHKLLHLIVVFGLEKQQTGSEAQGEAGEMLRQLEASRTGSMEQRLVDDILTKFGFD